MELHLVQGIVFERSPRVVYTGRPSQAVLEKNLVAQAEVSQRRLVEKVSSELWSVAGETLCDGVAHQLGRGVKVQLFHEARFVEVDGLHGDVE